MRSVSPCDWRRRDVLLLEHDAEFDVRGVGEDSGSRRRDRARVVCEVRRVVDATVLYTSKRIVDDRQSRRSFNVIDQRNPGLFAPR
jgi:hypothetical protein